jgi:hypothetical protein
VQIYKCKFASANLQVQFTSANLQVQFYKDNFITANLQAQFYKLCSLNHRANACSCFFNTTQSKKKKKKSPNLVTLAPNEEKGLQKMADNVLCQNSLKLFRLKLFSEGNAEKS